MRAHKKISKREAVADGALLLSKMDFSDPLRILKSYPVQFSGGMNQRVAIALAMALLPDLLLDDEPTSALDVSIQAQILELLREMGKRKKMSVLFISHDLAPVSSFCSRTYVMYKGKIVEHGDTAQVINHPTDEYTKRLISSVLT